MDQYSALRQYFGHSAFRGGQEPLIDGILAGRDVLGVMPTGGGKSLCYQIPALLLPGLSLVISPLISLMKDQVAALELTGIPAVCLNSAMTGEEYRAAWGRIRSGECRLVYIAPERLDNEGFLASITQREISLVAVDEAHCISQWGQDFRPSYRRIAGFVEALPTRPVVAAFTATATSRVREDIAAQLGLRDPVKIITGFDRPNLYFDVLRPRDKLAALIALVEERQGKSGIIYCATRSGVEQVCGALCSRGIPATRYHAGLSDEERCRNQEDFQFDRRPVMAATNAFGMGIDKSSVSYVIHYNMPKDLESYYQEAGRAGRDGEPADCILLFAPGDIVTAKFLIGHGGEEEDPAAAAERQKQDLERLSVMTGYCKTQGCYRGYLLDYFGQPHPEQCGRCGACQGERTTADITIPAQMILSCIKRVEKKLGYYVGQSLIIQTLRGGRGHRVKELGLDSLSTYGLMAGQNTRTIREYIDCLEAKGYTYIEAAHETLRPTPMADRVLFHGERVTMAVHGPLPGEASPRRRSGKGREEQLPREGALVRRTEAAPRKAPRSLARAPSRPDPGEEPVPASPVPSAGPGEPDPILLERLREKRTRLAQEARVPAYIIFANATLVDMAKRLPRSQYELLQVAGVGQVKAERYGKEFLEVIRRFLEEGS
ncbi:MAG: RecQ family ATP-dependent DNA helicase [Angelakisella sp.]|jgi:ATP-dependent DNA helicase RecQ|nr:RecQ family ATP-dependent DNA helicase [Angelakisella sp.]